jgi:hypothetical protein
VHEDVERDDDEPDKNLHPATGQAKKGEGERSLAGADGEDGEESGADADESIVLNVLQRKVGEMVSEAQGDVGRGARRAGEKKYLGPVSINTQERAPKETRWEPTQDRHRKKSSHQSCRLR